MRQGKLFDTFCGTLEYCAPEVLLGNRSGFVEIGVCWSGLVGLVCFGAVSAGFFGVFGCVAVVGLFVHALCIRSGSIVRGSTLGSTVEPSRCLLFLLILRS